MWPFLSDGTVSRKQIEGWARRDRSRIAEFHIPLLPHWPAWIVMISLSFVQISASEPQEAPSEGCIAWGTNLGIVVDDGWNSRVPRRRGEVFGLGWAPQASFVNKCPRLSASYFRLFI